MICQWNTPWCDQHFPRCHQEKVKNDKPRVVQTNRWLFVMSIATTSPFFTPRDRRRFAALLDCLSINSYVYSSSWKSHVRPFSPSYKNNSLFFFNFDNTLYPRYRLHSCVVLDMKPWAWSTPDPKLGLLFLNQNMNVWMLIRCTERNLVFWLTSILSSWQI